MAQVGTVAANGAMKPPQSGRQDMSSSLSFKQDLSMVAVMASVRSPMLFR